MKRIKALTVAVLAVGALAAPAAAEATTGVYITGTQIEASSYPAEITGTPDPYAGITNVLTTGSGWTISCSSVKYRAGEFIPGSLQKPAWTVYVYPSLTNCTFGNSPTNYVSATVNEGKCSYRFSGLKKDESLGIEVFSATAKLGCIEGTMTIKTSIGCTFTISNQTFSTEEATGFQNYTDPATGQAALLGLEQSNNVAFSTSGWGCQLVGVPAGSYTNGTSHLGMQLNATF